MRKHVVVLTLAVLRCACARATPAQGSADLADPSGAPWKDPVSALPHLDWLRPVERPGSSTFGAGSLTEMQRLFTVPADDDEPEAGPLGAKALLALPLLRHSNALQLLLRPQSDLYGTYARRIALRRFRGLRRISLSEGDVAVDLHVHTCYSHDSLADPADMLREGARRGLSGMAITDHDTLKGARKALEALPRLVHDDQVPASFFVIPGEEIGSADGHIIGLFLTEEIPAGLSAVNTVDRIHRQGGLAIAAHPQLSDGLKGLARTLPFDAVETQNAAEEVAFAGGSRKAMERRAEFYETVMAPRLGVSDAHDPGAVATSYTLLRHCATNASAVRQALLSGDAEPVEQVPDEEERRLARRGLARVLKGIGAVFGSGQDGPGMWLRRATHADAAQIRLLPRPELTWRKRF